jgi:shikimate dehydrogenase
MTARLAVLGNPIAHSRSPEIHGLFGEQTGIDLRYDRILVPENQFAAVAREFFAAPEAVGINITVPCKADAWHLADEKSDNAETAGAVNTLLRRPDGTFAGHNTDGAGLVADLKDNLGWQLANQRILVLGAGGAVRGVLANLLAEQPAKLHIWNRTSARAEALVPIFGGKLEALTADRLENAYDVIINGTSASLTAQQMTLPPSIIGAESCCYDMVYGPEQTRFNTWCLAQAPCHIADGLGMLVEQAAAAFEIWFGVRPQTRSVLELLRKTL